jgi:hypothetical protein
MIGHFKKFVTPLWITLFRGDDQAGVQSIKNTGFRLSPE